MKDQLVTLLSEAERYIEKSVATAIISAERNNGVNPATLQLLKDFRRETDSALEERIQSAVVKRTQSSTATIAQDLSKLVEGKFMLGLDQLHAVAIKKAETTAIDAVKQCSGDIEQRLLENLREQIIEFQNPKLFVGLIASTVNNQVSETVSNAMKDFEIAISNRIKLVRAQVVSEAEQNANESAGFYRKRPKKSSSNSWL